MIPWAWLHQYQKRRALGLCTTDYCQEYADWLCGKHGKQKAAYSKRWNKREYDRRKLAGLCVAKACGNGQSETSWYCAGHLAAYSENARKYRHTKRGRKRRRKIQRQSRRHRQELGLCTSGACPNELVTTTLCEDHRKKKADNSAAMRRARGVSMSGQKCTACRSIGHNIQTCQARTGHDDDMLPVEHYASSRTFVEIQD